MPYDIVHFSPKCWGVVNVETGRVHSKCSTKKNAEAQIRLLRGVEHGMVVRKRGKGAGEQKITVDVPLMIRIMEWAREDAKNDQQIHFATENMISKGKKILTMSDYADIFSAL